MLKVKVQSNDITTRSGNARVSGKPYVMKSQENCVVELPDGEVRKFSIVLGDDQVAWPVGSYDLDAGTLITVNQYGNFALKPFAHVELKPVSNSSEKPALFNKAA